MSVKMLFVELTVWKSSQNICSQILVLIGDQKIINITINVQSYVAAVL